MRKSRPISLEYPLAAMSDEERSVCFPSQPIYASIPASRCKFPLPSLERRLLFEAVSFARDGRRRRHTPRERSLRPFKTRFGVTRSSGPGRLEDPSNNNSPTHRKERTSARASSLLYTGIDNDGKLDRPRKLARTRLTVMLPRAFLFTAGLQPLAFGRGAGCGRCPLLDLLDLSNTLCEGVDLSVSALPGKVKIGKTRI
jgi:hypothetical protein